MAAWINHLNQVRLDELFEAWRQQDINLERAQDSLDEARKLIFEQIIARDRGGLKGMHGFIAEVAEVGVRNARNLVDGMPADTEWINNNGPADLIRNGIQIQQKFVQSGGKLSLNAVEEHLKKYPDFLKDGGKYQIPKDYFEKIQRYLAMTQEEAKLISSDNADGLSYKQWAWVQNFFKSGEISINDLEPSQNAYVSVQSGNIDNTLNDVQNEIEETHHDQQEAAYEQSKPSFAEGAKATAIAAVIEGGTAFVTEVVKKRKEKGLIVTSNYFVAENGVTRRSRRFSAFIGCLCDNRLGNNGNIHIVHKVEKNLHFLLALAAGLVRGIDNDLLDILVHDGLCQFLHIHIFLCQGDKGIQTVIHFFPLFHPFFDNFNFEL